ncbi:ferredoxin [Nocardia higoensis]|uniref:ferredoxin n=1 Tax=Nocardia higoensis TaxID=228599 RepID=UPI0002E92114|nr:ferredoxin [Nocardia higoensis]
MKVTVDADRCRGHGVCVTLCPEVFDINDDGYAEVIVGEVPERFEKVVDEAIGACPERAIEME